MYLTCSNLGVGFHLKWEQAEYMVQRRIADFGGMDPVDYIARWHYRCYGVPTITYEHRLSGEHIVTVLYRPEDRT